MSGTPSVEVTLSVEGGGITLSETQMAVLSDLLARTAIFMQKMNIETSGTSQVPDAIDAYAAVLRTAQEFAIDKAKRRLKSDWSMIL